MDKGFDCDEEEHMDFAEAMRLIAKGRHMTRLEWDDVKVYGYLNGRLMLNMFDGAHTWIVSDGDMQAKDWVEC